MKKFNIISVLFFLLFSFAFPQTQLGADIDGEAAGDNSGWSVSMRSHGSRLAIGASSNDGNGAASGHVRVYGSLGSAVSQNTTYVPDDNFEQALIDLGYDTTLDDSVLTENISSLTTLDVSGKEISNLTGIEAFTALTVLKINTNKLTSVDLSKNTALT